MFKTMLPIREFEIVAHQQVSEGGAPRMPVPYAPPLEDESRVTDAHIVAAAKQMCG